MIRLPPSLITEARALSLAVVAVLRVIDRDGASAPSAQAVCKALAIEEECNQWLTAPASLAIVDTLDIPGVLRARDGH